MPRSLGAYVEEILSAIKEIVSFTQDIDFKSYVKDSKTKAAVERKLLVIGEALNQCSQLKTGLSEQISDFKKIIAFRNLLVHDYFGIDDQIVWDVIKNKINRLKDEVRKL